VPVIWVKYYPSSGLLMNKYAHPTNLLTSRQPKYLIAGLALVAPEPGETHEGPEFPGLGCLPRRWLSQCALRAHETVSVFVILNTSEKMSKNSFLLKWPFYH
jgi:hypothetical protein